MENDFKKTYDNPHSEYQFNPKKSNFKKHKNLLKNIVVIIMFVVLMYYFLLVIGVIPVPKWYINLNFHLNKNHFERIVVSDFKRCSNFSGEIESYISKTDDEKLQKSMGVLFKGMWGGMTYDDYQHIYFFKPRNYTYARARGILYYEGNDILSFCDGVYYYRYRCEPLSDGWYYYEVAYKSKGV